MNNVKTLRKLKKRLGRLNESLLVAILDVDALLAKEERKAEVASIRASKPNPDSELSPVEWFDHTPGDPCPVSGDTYVNVTLRNGRMYMGIRADSRYWGAAKDPVHRAHEIVSYNVFKKGTKHETRPEPDDERWIGYSPEDAPPAFRPGTPVYVLERNGRVLGPLPYEHVSWKPLPGPDFREFDIQAYMLA
jgi:hypothetical protein